MFDNLKIGDKVVTIDIISRKGNIVGEIVNVNRATKFCYEIKVLATTEENHYTDYMKYCIGTEDTIVRNVDEITAVLS